MRKRTKIIATLGPATSTLDYLVKTISEGVDCVRINFSHGDADSQKKYFELTRQAASQLKREVAIMADLQGPKIRIGQFKNGLIELKPGDTFILDADLDLAEGDHKQVGLAYKSLPQDVKANDTLLLNDGLIVLTVNSVQQQKILCTVQTGGELSNNKGINRLGGGLSAQAITEKDIEDLKTAVDCGADYIAISFPRNAADILHAKTLLQQLNSNAGIIAKIERCEAVDNIDEIILASDAVMVARGDLGVEIGNAEVPGVQKMIIKRCRQLDRAVITATQMMESMITNAIPTRAEASDVANAVLDGTDAVMLSAETATGAHPDLVVATMSRICISAEKTPRDFSEQRFHRSLGRIDESIAFASMFTAMHFNVKAIITLTESGSTPMWMSRIRSGIPIYALSRSTRTQRRMTLYRGVYPLRFDPTDVDRRDVNRKACEVLERLHLVHKGDVVIITKGNNMGELGGTNAMKIVKIGEVV